MRRCSGGGRDASEVQYGVLGCVVMMVVMSSPCHTHCTPGCRITRVAVCETLDPEPLPPSRAAGSRRWQYVRP